MMRIFHTTVLLLIFAIGGNPMSAALADDTFPKPPHSVYEAIVTDLEDLIVNIEWFDDTTPPEFAVIFRIDEPLLYNQRWKLARLVCLKARTTWNPDCEFVLLAYEIPWLTEAAAICQKH